MTKKESKKSLSRNPLPRVACVMIVFFTTFYNFHVEEWTNEFAKELLRNCHVRKIININFQYRSTISSGT